MCHESGQDARLPKSRRPRAEHASPCVRLILPPSTRSPLRSTPTSSPPRSPAGFVDCADSTQRVAREEQERGINRQHSPTPNTSRDRRHRTKERELGRLHASEAKRNVPPQRTQGRTYDSGFGLRPHPESPARQGAPAPGPRREAPDVLPRWRDDLGLGSVVQARKRV